MSQDLFVSVLIPAKNEANNLQSLLEEVRLALADEPYQIIVVDDGSTDVTLHELRQIRHNGLSALRILHHERSLGQSTSLYHAALEARGQWLATLDGDGQNDPADIPGMLALVRGKWKGRATCNWWPGTGSIAAIPRANAGPRVSPTACAAACSGTPPLTPVAA